MFTGIVEEIGTIRHIDSRFGYQRTTVAATQVLDGVKIGDSISIEGVCHTVVAFDAETFVVESVAETLKRTTLGRFRVGTQVNLERSLKLGDRLDGHMVAGHVDGVGKVVARRESSDNVVFEFEMPDVLAPYIAEKGSAAIDGVSLTVVSVTESTFCVTIIPHTLAITTLSEKRPGDPVNLEVDMIARYLERLLQFGRLDNGLTEVRVRAMMSE